MSSLISISNVRKTFKDVQAVKGITLEINKGEFVALLGPNGAGKTTLMEMIEGIQHPDEGEIRINGMTWKGHEETLHRMLGISLQETHFFDKLKVIEIFDLFASFYGLGRERGMEILKLIRLEEKAKAMVKNLSGGQRQRVALGIALLNQPQILLLDEPTTGLDPTARRELWDILFELRNNFQMTMILTTHYMEEADYLCERIIIMDKGTILAEGNIEQLLSKTDSSEIIEFRLQNDAKPQHLPGTEGSYKLVRDDKNERWKLLVPNIINYLPAFLDEMKRENLSIEALECRKMTLDDLFISMTGRRLDE